MDARAGGPLRNAPLWFDGLRRITRCQEGRWERDAYLMAGNHRWEPPLATFYSEYLI